MSTAAASGTLTPEYELSLGSCTSGAALGQLVDPFQQRVTDAVRQASDDTLRSYESDCPF